MNYRIAVLVKQVPDTHNISGEVMKEDGTVNRAALPAIFNPEDMNALEEALKIKEKHGGEISVITMGPPNAVKVLKESLYRGVDKAVLVSDRQFAGADTLATSYALSLSIKKMGEFDLIFCGRQAIDGDTAQVGPQTAEKLKMNQVTSVDSILELSDNTITVRRQIDGGDETVRAKLPALLTITSDANTPRPPAIKKLLAYKNAKTEFDIKDYDEEYLSTASEKELKTRIPVYNHEDIGASPEQCGLKGSPTKVKQIESVVLEADEFKKIENTQAGFKQLITELMNEHIIG